MHQELESLLLADYSERFEVNGSEAYLIINKKMTDHPCLFGFTKLQESWEDVAKLFQNIEHRAKEMGYQNIVGPVNYCSWMSYRWTISNYETKLFPDCENPPYYVDYIQRLGYQALYTYRSADIDIHNPMFAIGEEIYRQKLSEGYTFSFYEGESAYAMADTIFEISKEAFRGSYLYCDIPNAVFQKIYLSWMKAIHPVMYVAYHDNKPIGYVLGYESPDGKCFISKTSAVLTQYQKHKIYTALLYLGYRYVLDQGYRSMMYHFQCEQKNIFRRFEKDIESNEKRYAVFIKEL
ncbi:MAG: GNAT family N-acetyltransferase [Oscillospiraceae bacterium]|nr:GNAT family N-acetyltransferase [Oscillospiraceae bacterium]